MMLLALRERFKAVVDEFVVLWTGKEAFGGISLLLEAPGGLRGCSLTENVGLDYGTTNFTNNWYFTACDSAYPR